MARETSSEAVVPADVARVQDLFERWRKHKQRRDRIPAQLWAQATKLCEGCRYTVNRVALWLRLNTAALRERAESRGRSRRRQRKAPAFVELAPAPMPGPEYVLEVRDSEGSSPHACLVVRVRGAAVGDVAALARSLRKDGGEGGVGTRARA